MSTKHIVRAPSTDRYLIEIPDAIVGEQGPTGPTGATGPTGPQGTPGVDYTPVFVHGTKTFTGEQEVTQATPATVELDTDSDLLNVSSGTYLLTPDYDGLFLVTFEVTWGGAPVPDATLRKVELKNDTSTVTYGTAAPSAYANVDSGSVLIRLQGADKLIIVAYHDDAAANANITYAKLSLVRVAP